MSDDVVWGEAPAEHKRSANRGKWKRLAEEVAQRPGEWASVEVGRDSGYQVRHRFNHGAFGEGFEAVTRSTEDGGRRLFVRYVGKPNLKAAR